MRAAERYLVILLLHKERSCASVIPCQVPASNSSEDVMSGSRSCILIVTCGACPSMEGKTLRRSWCQDDAHARCRWAS
eukprot:5334198-Pyramimonas_sp.AAC.1